MVRNHQIVPNIASTRDTAVDCNARLVLLRAYSWWTVCPTPTAHTVPVTPPLPLRASFAPQPPPAQHVHSSETFAQAGHKAAPPATPKSPAAVAMLAWCALLALATGIV